MYIHKYQISENDDNFTVDDLVDAYMIFFQNNL